MKQFSLSLLALSVLTMCTCLHAMGQEKPDEAQPVRTLRVLVGGVRAMPSPAKIKSNPISFRLISDSI